ncbi:hypothetical protein EV187_2663 [Agromyces ramosus]|uniref:Uncharacterized protein n=1 Tax=Agromyces ramosus TaxID=33879 RepID=A0A4Q7MAM6_9MICO|nr:hypothetical protein [Agromyces ramosus]RZS64283.1 hypothetical protein EV187_2663 [Agromyces ramosus]
MSSTTPGSDPDRPHDAEAVDGDLPHDTEAVSPDEASGSSTSEAPAASERDVPAEPEFVAPDPVAADPPAPEPEATAAPMDEPEHVEPAYEPEPVEPAYEPVVAAAPVTGPEPVEQLDATARLDAAVERANAAPVASDRDDVGDADVPAPVAADSVRRDTYVPAATVAAGTAAGAATLAPEPDVVPTVPAAPQTIYVQAPTPPKTRGNRGFGVLVALIGAVAFALLYAGASYLVLLVQRDPVEAGTVFAQFIVQPVFWVPVVACFLGFALLAAIVNRGAWWYYAVFGLLVGVLVYFAYIGAALLTVEAWTLNVDQAGAFIQQRWLDPFAIVAGVIAREIPIWFGGWIAARGRTVTDRNRLAREAYDRELAAGPQPQRVA